MRFRSGVFPSLCAGVCFLFPEVIRVGSVRSITPPAPRAITVDDVFEIHDVRDPRISDDGEWVAYTVSTMSLKEDKTETRIWMAPTDESGDAIVMTAEKSRRRIRAGVRMGSFSRFFPSAVRAKRQSGCSIAWAAKRRS